MIKFTVKKESFLIVTAVGLLTLTSIQCTKKEQHHTRDDFNNAANATKNVLREVAEGINNAVYKK